MVRGGSPTARYVEVFVSNFICWRREPVFEEWTIAEERFTSYDFFCFPRFRMRLGDRSTDWYTLSCGVSTTEVDAFLIGGRLVSSMLRMTEPSCLPAVWTERSWMASRLWLVPMLSLGAQEMNKP